jgi:capsular polysaccharide transport system permease protein
MKQGFRIIRRAVLALFLRELKTRFGKYRLGYLWAIASPAAQVAILVALREIVGARTTPDISFPVFLITGVVVFGLFSSIADRSLSAVAANSGLFNYRAIRPIDTVIARAILEFCISIGVYAVLMGIVAVLGERVGIESMPMLLVVFLVMSLFSFGVGLIFMVIGDAFVEADKILPLLTRVLFFVSGVFFSPQMVPSSYRDYMLWNPILHAIEIARHAVFPSYHIDPGVSLGYLMGATLIAVTLGMALYRRHELAMLTT